MLDTIFAPGILISIFALKLVIKKITRIDLDEVLGMVIYFLFLVHNRILRWGWDNGWGAIINLKSVDIKLPMKKETITSVLDVNSVLRMSGLEVMLGVDPTKRPIRIDLEKGHTILAGTTGFGKTIALNGIIAQLVTRPYFREQYDLYLLDLKSSKYDYLTYWKPVVTGYYGIDENGSSEQAIEALEKIAEQMHRQESDKKIVIIIDELAMLTSQATDPKMRQRGKALLQKLAAQIRDRGTILAATQRVHYETIDRMVAANMDRKICLHVDDNNDAKLVLRFKPTVDCTAFRHGDFVLKEPGAKNREQVGRTLMMSLPREIDIAIANIIEINAENDDRLKIFRMAAGTKAVGDGLPGVRQPFWKNSGYKVPYLQTAYRNFHNAGAVIAKVDKRQQPSSYVMALEFADAYKKVVEYIQAGQWESAPETIGRENEE